MFNYYMIHEIGRLEHEERVRSLTPIPDFGGPAITNEPRWALRQIALLLHTLASGSASLRRSIKEQRANSIQRDLRRVKE